MTKFRNLTDDTLVVPALGFEVPVGDTTPDLAPDVAAGFELQTDTWAAVDDPKPAPPAPAATPSSDVKEND